MKAIFCSIIVMACASCFARTVELEWKEGVERPVEVLDFGPETVGGYAVFEVESFSPAKDGTLPVLRLAYANHPDGLSETGDFTREGCIGYLHVDNPVLPANVNRHDLFTIPRKGRYVAPLLQGQLRYVRAQLDVPGTALRLSSLEIVNAGTHSKTPPCGTFNCSDARLDAIWKMCARTAQMASIPNPDAWHVVSGVLLPRKLERAGGDGWSRFVPDFEGSLEVEYEFRTNPHFPKQEFTVFTGWLDEAPGVLQKIANDDVDGTIRKATVPLKPGRFGFRLEKDNWPVIHSVVVKDLAGKERWRDDFSQESADGTAANWTYPKAAPYIADGGKRDRLVWSGDLWFAVGSIAYCFGQSDVYFQGALRLLAFNQTPEGYCQACPYAENDRKLLAGEWGLFASDEFSAWIVPSAWQWYLYSGDKELMRELWPAIDRQLCYIAAHMGKDGLFDQRFETSKHALDMNCSNSPKRLYSDLVYWLGWKNGASLARAIGNETRADELEKAAAEHASAIRRHYNPDGKNWRCGDRDRAMLLASGFVQGEEAKALTDKKMWWLTGKWRSMLLRGLMENGATEKATEYILRGAWAALANPFWRGAHTASECLFMTNNGFWDESHPDVLIADVISAYILGISPIEPGFRKFRVAPKQTSFVNWSKGTVPTAQGDIAFEWKRTGETLSMRLTVPQGAQAVLADGEKFATGTHEIVRNVKVAERNESEISFPNFDSQPYKDKDAKYELLFDLDKERDIIGIDFDFLGEQNPAITIEGAGIDGSFRAIKTFPDDAKGIRYVRMTVSNMAYIGDGYKARFKEIKFRFNP